MRLERCDQCKNDGRMMVRVDVERGFRSRMDFCNWACLETFVATQRRYDEQRQSWLERARTGGPTT